MSSLIQKQPKSMTPGELSITHSMTSSANDSSTHVKNERSLNFIEESNRDEVDLSQRLDLSVMIEQFISFLGREHWAKYAQITSLFILGKLSRKELLNQLNDIFQNINDVPRSKLIRLHNQLLLGIMTNSLKESPLGLKGDFDHHSGSNGNKSWGFSNGSGSLNRNIQKRVVKHNSQIETYKKIVMSLPTSDRNRLRLITKEAGKRGFIYCTVLQNRLNNIPKIPTVSNPETLKRVKANNLKTPLEWSQDIMNGFNAPLSTDNFSLPDSDSLYLKMTGIARENGLVGTIDTRCVDMVSNALDHFLKSIIEYGIDSVRYRQKRYSDYYDLNDDGVYVPVADLNKERNAVSDLAIADDGNKIDKISQFPKISLTNEDIYNALSILPNLVEPTSGAYHNLTTNGLVNDDELVIMKSQIDDLPEFSKEKPLFTPLNDRNVGTREELNWLIKDILTEE
ncbi:hypothetical protein KAFR_0F00960 [Kazachstania africana CBS 2517]|uniref:Transcriptional coactivator HFI1/ADA1 n=1 Tax=Kazachstania africana (strain ATCC 22294 / BCRC 22015 / CBS 2517 / CECT 1963 / NBRC 1671 / NRRL Y-8276) TaxID=1071382 RepID=H2AWE3_KAZAF|nr:hypothetical protein KAFR_0F00960 [Kazachstania africana CBS 2517]CCF58693.1 hypothetical protein KAFR_0F00960 [Kazachstania africana CBS 2517]